MAYEGRQVLAGDKGALSYSEQSNPPFVSQVPRIAIRDNKADRGPIMLPAHGAGDLVAYRLGYEDSDEQSQPFDMSHWERGRALQGSRREAPRTPANSAASNFGSPSAARSDLGSAFGSVSASKRDVIWEDSTAAPSEPAASELADKISMPIEHLAIADELARWPPAGSALGVQDTAVASSSSSGKQGRLKKVAQKAKSAADSLHDKALQVGDKLYQKRRS